MHKSNGYNLDEISARRSIVLFANPAQLSKIKTDLLIHSDQIVGLGNDIYKIELDPIEVDVPEIMYDMSVEDFEGIATAGVVKVHGFHNSEAFYVGALGRGGYKIISDEFSDELNFILYKGFNRIEAELRQLVLENSKRKGGLKINSRFYSKENADHAISTFQLSDFIERLLKAPASNGYMKAQWRASAKTENHVVRIARLTRLDEIDPGLSFQELNTLRNQRNKCMHFNVVTVDDYKSTAPLINKYLRASASRMMSKTFSDLSKSLSNHLTSFDIPNKFYSELLSHQLESSNNLSHALRDLLGR